MYAALSTTFNWPQQWYSKVDALVEANMRRFLLSTALALYFSLHSAIAADRFGEWLLEQPRSFVLTLSFKKSVPLNNKIATSELGFVCDQGDKSKVVGGNTYTRRWNVRKSAKDHSCFDFRKTRTNMIPLIFYSIGKMEPTISSWNQMMMSISLHRF